MIWLERKRNEVEKKVNVSLFRLKTTLQSLMMMKLMAIVMMMVVVVVTSNDDDIDDVDAKDKWDR
jgi:hypothetical protein